MGLGMSEMVISSLLLRHTSVRNMQDASPELVGSV